MRELTSTEEPCYHEGRIRDMSEQRIELDAVTNLPFGARLRQLREAAGLTQEELAVRAGLSRNAVGALERGLHKRPYPHTVRSLAHALGLSEEERTALLSAVPKEGSADASLVPAPSTESSLPTPSTSLLGRERELGEIRTFLQEARLLTLTGTGGVGKTRLTVEAARDAARLFPDSTVFVALAPLGDSGFVLSTIAQSLGLRESGDRTPHETLHAYLREKRLLLVLDNFEHALKAASEVAKLIEACPRLSVLVTSRAPLRVRGEQEYPVPPLALPASTIAPSVEELVGSASSRLFAERAGGPPPLSSSLPTTAGR